MSPPNQGERPENDAQNSKSENLNEITVEAPKNGITSDSFNENKKKPPFGSSPSICSDISGEVVLRPHIGRLALTTPNGTYLRKTHSTNDLQKYGKKNTSPRNKRDNMVLQLVIPSNSFRNSGNNYDNYLTTHSFDEYMADGGTQEPRKAHSASIHSRQGDYSPEPIGYIPPRSPGALSVAAYGPDDPTSQSDKKEAFISVLTRTLSLFYALFNVTLGLALYVSDIVDGSHSGSEIFSLVMVSVAFLYVLYLIIDISLYTKRKEKYEKLLVDQIADNVEMKETPDGHYQVNVQLPSMLKKSIRHDYCFNKDRHSTNFFLKIGAAAFCFGHLIHSGLLFGYQIIFLTSEDRQFYECASIPTVILDIIYPIYSFFLLFFIYKYSNIIINRNVILARFGIIHCLSASICFWIWTIFREILETIANKQYKSEGEDDPEALPQHFFNRQGAEIITQLAEAANISMRRFTAMCEYSDDSIKAIYRDFSPYLYPFSVEFSILIVGIWFLVWQNIGICKAENEEAATTQCNNPLGMHPDYKESNVTVHVDCHSSNKGLFGGLLVLVLTIVSTILFFITVYFSKNSEAGVLLNLITSLIILTLMTLTCIFAYLQITKLDLNSAHHNMLDDFLLFICIPAYFLNGIFSIIPAIVHQNAVSAVNIVLEVCQVLLQTVFILDGVRRSSNTRLLRKVKPGREMVTFLIIANIALWLLQTFEVKSHDAQDARYEFYGKELWTILGHLCLPLMMFYRFHSAVCFGDIWKYAYEPSGH